MPDCSVNPGENIMRSHSHIVSGIYASRAEAETVRGKLIEQGLPRKQIKVVERARAEDDNPKLADDDQVLKEVLVDGTLGTLVGEAREAEPAPEPFVLLRPAEEGFSVLRDDDGAWRVTGRSAERAVAMADLTNIEALEYVQQRLRKLGVERALARAGAREGDVVRIGPVELDYVEGLG